MRCGVYHFMDVDEIKRRLKLAPRLEKLLTLEVVLERVSRHTSILSLYGMSWVSSESEFHLKDLSNATTFPG
jgi:hypothetical protein